MHILTFQIYCFNNIEVIINFVNNCKNGNNIVKEGKNECCVTAI